MIVFDLRCGHGHGFEGWFASAEDFSAQRSRGLLSCPSCNDARIERRPSAARINLGAPAPAPAKADPQTAGKDAFAIAQVLYSRMLDEMLQKSEDVGAEFPSEARKIYYKEAASRAIRGQATPEEHQELVDEGIPVARLPIPPGGRWN
jgi:hypothetical protein